MNKIIKNLLLAGDKFMLEMHSKQPGFTYSVCVPFTKNKQRIKKIMQTGDTNYISIMNWIKLVFNMTWLMEILKT